jgi:hypothetical protein
MEHSFPNRLDRTILPDLSIARSLYFLEENLQLWKRAYFHVLSQSYYNSNEERTHLLDECISKISALEEELVPVYQEIQRREEEGIVIPQPLVTLEEDRNFMNAIINSCSLEMLERFLAGWELVDRMKLDVSLSISQKQRWSRFIQHIGLLEQANAEQLENERDKEILDQKIRMLQEEIQRRKTSET